MRKPAYNICHAIFAVILPVVSQHAPPFKESMPHMRASFDPGGQLVRVLPNNPAAGDYNCGGGLRIEEASTAGDEGVTVTSDQAIVSQGKSVWEITNRLRHLHVHGRKKVSTCGVCFY